MSNKDYYGQPQQQYYPPAGAAFSHDVIILILTRVCILGPPGQGGYYPQQPQQAYQGYGGQPGYQPQPQPQPVYVYVLMFYPGAGVSTAAFCRVVSNLHNRKMTTSVRHA
jgi:hypothetical protein